LTTICSAVSVVQLVAISEIIGGAGIRTLIPYFSTLKACESSATRLLDKKN
jgi:hypothetical protein